MLIAAQRSHRQALLNAKTAALQHLEKGRHGTFQAPRPQMPGSQDENQGPTPSPHPHSSEAPSLSELIEQNRTARERCAQGLQHASPTTSNHRSPYTQGSFIAQTDGSHESSPTPHATSGSFPASGLTNSPKVSTVKSESGFLSML